MTIALFAHCSKTDLLANLCVAYRRTLEKHSVVSTGGAGRAVEDAANFPVRKFLPGHVGGRSQLFALIELGEIDLVISFLGADGRQQDCDARALARLCEQHNVPYAGNLATAEALLRALERGDLKGSFHAKTAITNEGTYMPDGR